MVTGGGGFIGSHLVEHLLKLGNDVHIVDDFSNSNANWVPSDAKLTMGDLTNCEIIEQVVGPEIDIVIHLAARKDPNDDDPDGQFVENTTMTRLLLKECQIENVNEFVFASSSTIYGEAPRPTPENYAPLEPISVYGASKLGEEGLVSSYAHSHGINSYIFRFANIVGPRLRGAVIPDFIEKVRSDPKSLTILGDGRQEKSYMHITDCVEAMCHVINSQTSVPVSTFNLGTKTTTSVDQIANIVCNTLDESPDYQYTGGDRGWKGDVPKMRLSTEKLTSTGWEPKYESDMAVRLAVKELATELSKGNYSDSLK
nr:NAD-dependent epimerase/dehydratase family protein [Natronolimnobius sp. AArcel1]